MSRRSRNPLRLLVVADAGPRVGLGHLMRTRALVEALRERRPLRAAWLGSLGAHEARLLRGWGFGARRTPPRARIAALAAALREIGPHVVIFDAYRRMEAELRLAARSGAATVLFDDLERRGTARVSVRIGPAPRVRPGRPHGARSGAPPRPARLHLAGPRHLCLRREIAAVAERPRRPPRRTVIAVSLGGGSAPGLARLLERLRREFEAEEWVVVARPGTPVAAPAGAGRSRGARTARPAGRGRLRCAWTPRASARALASATAAVCAAGTTAWELACLGVPAVLWVRVWNQEPIARALDGRAALRCRRRTDLPRALARLLGDPALARRLSRGGRRLVDGRGAQRVARAILRVLGGPGGGRAVMDRGASSD